MLIDQDTGRVKGTFVEFFGRAAWTATGPAALARLTGASLLPGALVRSDPGRYRFVLDGEVERSETGDREFDDWETTRRATLALEGIVRRWPDQWTWFHRRWGTDPPAGWQPPAVPGTRAGR
jgi:KDO2-lipid IV(A) lauroyltransferase